jgi:hypothetical protein
VPVEDPALGGEQVNRSREPDASLFGLSPSAGSVSSGEMYALVTTASTTARTSAMASGSLPCV